MTTPISRGRPRKHYSNKDRQAAYRARLRKKRDQQKRRQHSRDLARLRKAAGKLRLRILNDGTVTRYLRPTAAELKLANEILVACGLGVSQGLFVKGAPTGCGQIVYGAEGSHRPTVILADGRLAPLYCGHRVKGTGWNSHRDENFGGKGCGEIREWDETFAKKEIPDESEHGLTCHWCSRPPWGIREIEGKSLFHCELHAPVGEFRNVNLSGEGKPSSQNNLTEPPPAPRPAAPISVLGVTRAA